MVLTTPDSIMSNILTHHDINAAEAKRLRKAAGLSQSDFWAPLGVKQAVGCRYEADVRIPTAVRILMVTRYVCGLQIDTSSRESVTELRALAAAAASDASISKVKIAKAKSRLKAACDALDGIAV
jgi:predicted transcriptional regulator